MVKKNPDKRPPDNPKPSIEPSLKIKLAIAGVIIFAISISSGFVILQINQVSLKENTFAPYFLTISNPTRLNESMYITVNLESQGSIAAQKDITVYSRLAPNHELRGDNGFGYTDLPAYFILSFDGTFCPQGTIDKYGSQNACSIVLHKVDVKDKVHNPNGFNYEGTGIIKYSTGGQFGILLGANFDETTGTADAIASNSAFINIVSLEDSQQVEYGRAAVYLAIPLAVIGAAISIIPILASGRK